MGQMTNSNNIYNNSSGNKKTKAVDMQKLQDFKEDQ